MRISIIYHSNRMFVVRFGDDGKPSGCTEVLVNDAPPGGDDVLITFWGSHLSEPCISYGIANGFISLSKLIAYSKKGWTEVSRALRPTYKRKLL